VQQISNHPHGPPCKKAPPTFNQKSEPRVTLKKGYLQQWCRSVGMPIAEIFTELQLFTETKKQF